MSKPYPRMQCAVCKRPIAKAAALLGGYPVGPVCAASQGLLPFGRGGGARQRAADTGTAAAGTVVRDTQTIDLFGGV